MKGVGCEASGEMQVGGGYKKNKPNKLSQHTVDGDGNSLSQSVAIGTLESRDLALGRDLAELSTRVELGGRVSSGLDQLQVQVVVLGSDQDGDGARVVLERGETKSVKMKKKRQLNRRNQEHTGRP